MTINQAGPGFCSELYERREYTHKIAVARPWLDIWQCSNKWQRERRVQTLWPRVRRPLSTLTRDITLVPLAKIGLIVSLLVKRRINGLNVEEILSDREFFENLPTLVEETICNMNLSLSLEILNSLNFLNFGN